MENVTQTNVVESAPSVNSPGVESQPQAGFMSRLPEEDLKALSTLEKPKAEPVKEEAQIKPDIKADSAPDSKAVADSKVVDMREYNKAREDLRKHENKIKEYEDRFKADEGRLEFAKQLESAPDLKEKIEALIKEQSQPKPAAIDPEIAKKLEAVDKFEIADEYKAMFKDSLNTADKVGKLEPFIGKMAQALQELLSEREAFRAKEAETKESNLGKTYESLDKSFEDMLKKDGLVKDGFDETAFDTDENLGALGTLLVSRLNKAGYDKENPPPSEVLKDVYEACKKILKIEATPQVQHKLEELKKLPVHTDESNVETFKRSSRYSKEVEDDLKFIPKW